MPIFGALRRGAEGFYFDLYKVWVILPIALLCTHKVTPIKVPDAYLIMTTVAMPSAEINLRAIEEFSWTAKSEPDFRKRIDIAMDYLCRILECDRGLVFSVSSNGNIEILSHFGWDSEHKRYLNAFMQQLIGRSATDHKRLRMFRPAELGVDASIGSQAIVLHHQRDDIDFYSSVITTRTLEFTHADSLLVSALIGIALEVPETRPIKRKKDITRRFRRNTNGKPRSTRCRN